MAFFLETLFGGLMAGMLYSLVALGFVLIFKASGVFNFAQGAMVLFAALTIARLSGEIDGKEVHLANFVVAAAILGVAVAFIGWYAWREYVARGAGPGGNAAGKGSGGQPDPMKTSVGYIGHDSLARARAQAEKSKVPVLPGTGGAVDAAGAGFTNSKP